MLANVERGTSMDGIKNNFDLLEAQVLCEFRKELHHLHEEYSHKSKINAPDCPYRLKALKQNTPFRVNRYIIGFFIIIYVFIRGNTYWGWNGIQDMLYKSGAYSNLCEVPYESEILIGGVAYPDCSQRKSSINDLYTVALAAQFTTSVLAGAMLDWIGPRLVTLVAVLIDVTGWTLIAVSNETFHGYYFGALFLGMSSDCGYLPILSFANLFPGNESFVIGILGAVRSLSFSIPVIMGAIFATPNFNSDELYIVLSGYICIGLGYCLLVATFLVPMKPYKATKQFLQEDINESHLEKKQELLHNFKGKYRILKKCGEDKLKYEPGTIVLPTEEYETLVTNMNELENSLLVNASTIPFGDVMLKPQFLLMIPVFVISILRAEFYTKSNRQQLVTTDGTDLTKVFSIMNILTFIPGPIMGKAIDSLGILPVMIGLNVCGVMMYVFLMNQTAALKVLSIIFYWIYTSFVISMVYCYVSLKLPSEYFGKLTGIICLIGGLCALSSIAWYRLATETLKAYAPKNFYVVDGVFVFLGLMLFLVFYGMHRADTHDRHLEEIEEKIIEEEERLEAGERRNASDNDLGEGRVPKNGTPSQTSDTIESTKENCIVNS